MTSANIGRLVCFTLGAGQDAVKHGSMDVGPPRVEIAMPLLILVLILSLGSTSAAATVAESYSLQSSWPAPDAGFIASDGPSLWVLNSSGTHVTHYSAAGAVIEE